MKKLATLAALGLLIAASGALAQTPRVLGTFKDWAAYQVGSGDSRVCYALAQPEDMEPKNVRRGDVYFFVTSRPGDKVKNEVSIVIGYPFRAGSDVTVEIGSDKFKLFTQQDGAWVADAGEERRLVEAMKRGARMTIKGTSSRGTLTTDLYSLSGVTAAIEKAASTCS